MHSAGTPLPLHLRVFFSPEAPKPRPLAFLWKLPHAGASASDSIIGHWWSIQLPARILCRNQGGAESSTLLVRVGSPGNQPPSLGSLGAF